MFKIGGLVKRRIGHYIGVMFALFECGGNQHVEGSTSGDAFTSLFNRKSKVSFDLSL